MKKSGNMQYVRDVIATNSHIQNVIVYDETDSIIYDGTDVPEDISNAVVLYHEIFDEYIQIIIRNNYLGYKTKNTIVIAGFPGTGKSYFFNNNSKYVVLDSDSSNFSWLEPGVRNPDFPNNYINHIKENIGVADIIFVSTHKEVRKALRENYIIHYIVYPDVSCKGEYIDRYKQRNSNESFINMMNNNWESFITEIESESNNVYKLKHNETMATFIHKLVDLSDM